MGRPARKLATRATFIPCSASGMAQPRITSSISVAVELRDAGEGAGDGDGGEVVGAGGAEGSAWGFADGGADCGGDDYFVS